MAGKLSPHAQMKLASLQAMSDKVQRVYGLVERFAAAREPRQAEMLALPVRRAFGRLKLELMGAGLDTLSQLAGSMEIAARRGASHQTKTRILREGIGSLRFQVEMEQRKILSDEAAARAEEAAARAEEPADRDPDAQREPGTD